MWQPIMIVINMVGAGIMTGYATDSIQAGIAVAAALVGLLLAIDHAADRIVNKIRG